MDEKKRLEVLNNAMALLIRAELRGGEAKAAAETIDYIKSLYEEAAAAVASLQVLEPKEVEQVNAGQ